MWSLCEVLYTKEMVHKYNIIIQIKNFVCTISQLSKFNCQSQLSKFKFKIQKNKLKHRYYNVLIATVCFVFFCYIVKQNVNQ